MTNLKLKFLEKTHSLKSRKKADPTRGSVPTEREERTWWSRRERYSEHLKT